MKKAQSIILILIAGSLIFSAQTSAQSPEEISYQAVIFDAGNNLVVNTTVGMQISILQGSASGTVVYQETHTPLSDANGLVTLKIASGTIISGTFSTIDWGAGPYFIKTETDPAGGTAYSITGISQLLSVPFALYAKEAETFSETDPVFSSSPAKGIAAADITRWDQDSDPANEIQALSLTGSNLTLSKGGGVVTLPSSSGVVGYSAPLSYSFGYGGLTDIKAVEFTLTEQKTALIIADASAWGGSAAFSAGIAIDVDGSVVSGTEVAFTVPEYTGGGNNTAAATTSLMVTLDPGAHKIILKGGSSSGLGFMHPHLNVLLF